MDVKDMNRNSLLYLWRERDHRNREVEYLLYLGNPRARSNGCGIRVPEPIPFLRSLGVKIVENKAGYPYYAIGCYTSYRDPAARWYTPTVLPDDLKDYYDTLPNKLFKTVLKPHSDQGVIDWMREGITGAVETEAYE